MLKIRELCVTLHGILEKRHILMKQIKTTYLLLAILLGSLAACSKMSDSEVTLYDDAAITSFTLGTVNRYVDGYKSTIKGSEYRFNIDQNSHTIYNADSLPKGSDVAHIVCGVTTYNNSMAYVVSKDGTYMNYHSSADSLDFTTPRTFRVFSSNGSGYTDYTVKVNVHKEDPDSFVWKKMADIPVMNDLCAIKFNDRIYVFGNEGGTTKAYTTEDGSAWTAVTLPAMADADTWQNTVATIDSLYIMGGTKIYRTHDLVTWDEDKSIVLDGTKIDQLIGASDQEIYGISNNGMLMTKYRGNLDMGSWIPADFESDFNTEDLPTEDFTFTYYPMAYADSTDYVVMAGTKQTDGVWHGHTWRRIVDYSEQGILSELKKLIEEAMSGSETVSSSWIRQWTYIDRSSNRLYELPALHDLQVIYYGGELLAFGGRSYDNFIEPLTAFWRSRDNGITWKQDVEYSMPPIDGTTKFNNAATSFSTVVDDAENIWIVCAGTGEVWRGRLNKVAWDQYK